MNASRTGTLVTLFAFLVGAAGCHTSEARHPVVSIPLSPRLRIDGATIVDPRAGTLRPGMSLVLQDGRIVSVSPTASTPIDAKTKTIDATGGFITPGYNDMHVHVFDQANAAAVLVLMLADGITGFRQMSGSSGLLEQRRAHTLPLDKDAPALLAMSGEILTPLAARSVVQAQQQIEQQKQQGADFIKMGLASPDIFFASIAAAKQAGLPIVGHLQEGVSAAKASDAGLHSIEHLGPGTSVWIGCSIEEVKLANQAAQQPPLKLPAIKLPGFVVDRITKVIQKRLINPAAYQKIEYTRLLQRSFDTYSQEKCHALAARFAANGTWHTPTLVRLRTQEMADDPVYLTDSAVPYITPNAMKQWRDVTERFHGLPQEMRVTYAEAYRRQLALTKLLADSGVRMMVGTDSGGQAPGQSIHQEFDQLAAAGLSPLQILQMTTTNPADFLGRSSTIGEVAPGYNADLVILDGNPLANTQNLHHVRAVIRAGFYYSRMDLERLREQVRTDHGEVSHTTTK